MAVSIDKQEDRWLIQLDGEGGVAHASELKNLLREGLAVAHNLELDLGALEEADVSLLQLLLALEKVPRPARGRVTAVSDAAAAAARDAGFDRFPCLAGGEEDHG